MAKKLKRPLIDDKTAWPMSSDFTFDDPRLCETDSNISNKYSIPLLEGLKPSIKEKLLKSSLHITAQPGDCLAKKGALLHEIGYIINGKIDLISNNHTTQSLTAGSLFGQRNCIYSCPIESDLIVKEKSEILLFNYNYFLKKVKNRQKIFDKMLST